MKFLLQKFRNYPLTSVCILTIWYLSFFTPPKTQLDNVAFIDKWVHVVMYGGTCLVMWIEYLRHHSRPLKSESEGTAPLENNTGKRDERLKLFLYAWFFPVLMSGLIELLQAYCTDGRRSGDWIDLAANATGVTIAGLLGSLMLKYHPGKKRIQ